MDIDNENEEEQEDDGVVYDPIEVDPLDILFDKIHKARGGEIFAIHVSPYGKNGPTVHICSVMSKNESILSKILPSVVEKFLNE